MTMFNWSPSAGQSSVSSYLWVYFVIAVPLTVLVLGIWWCWHRARARYLKRGRGGRGGGDSVELGSAPREKVV